MATAVWFRGPRVVELGPVPLDLPEKGQVLVRTLVSGISSGTEMLAYRGELDPELSLDETLSAFQGTFSYPFRYGYSCVGQVEQGCEAVPPGALVFAFHPHQDRFVASATDVVVLDEGAEGVDPRQASMFPLVETALQVSLDAGLAAGGLAHETVVVLGLGAVGLLCSLVLSQEGAHVLAADPVPWRRQLAASLGIQTQAPDELGQGAAEATGGRGVPLVVEASGNPDALAGGLALLAHEGTALVASWYGTKSARLPLGGPFHRRRLTIRSTQVSTVPTALAGRWPLHRRRRVALGLMSRLPLSRLATHQFAFADAAEAYAAVDRGQAGLVHAALSYGALTYGRPEL